MAYHWSIHQLTEYLVAVSSPAEPDGAVQVALERALEALEAELGAVVVAGRVIGHAGFGSMDIPAAFVVPGDDDSIEVPGVGETHLTVGRLDTPDGRTGTADAVLVVGRAEEPYSAEERQMLQGMALVLGLRLHSLARLAGERQRHRLVENLLQIQRGISARRPLDEVLDAVTSGASALLGGGSVALLLTEPVSRDELLKVSHETLPETDPVLLEVARRVLVEGEGGIESPSAPGGTVLVERVVVAGETVGCLAARAPQTSNPGHDPGELLTAFAQQVNLALTDARMLDAVREAHRDPITALPNRALFLQYLDTERDAAIASGDPLTVLFIDLDRFKAVNDTLGHRAGDHLLAEVAHRILHCTSDWDLAARLGGDEFAVMLRGGDQQVGRVVAERIITSLTRTFTIEGRDVLIGASVGVASLTDAAQSGATLLSDADVAMYCAKRSGRGQWVAFEPRMHEDVANQLGLRTDLRTAVEAGQLWLAYQPLVSLATGAVEGVEALLRWNHPVRGAVPPDEFIPLAEESDTIDSLGRFVVEQGLPMLGRWRQELPGLHLALNITGRQVMDPKLPEVLGEELRRLGLPGDAVTLEITESVLMHDPELARQRLGCLKELGIRLAIDDFGTGYSSLSYLRQFPVDQVKIDRSFIRGLRPGAVEEVALVRSIVELCRTLRLQTVAEGIEEREQLDVLTELGCDLGQGYLFSRPVTAEQDPHRAGLDVVQGSVA